MNHASNIISSIHALRQAKEYWEDFQRTCPGSKGAKLFEVYIKKVDWIATDLITHPVLPEAVREGIKKEWNSDVFAVDAITEKIAMLTPEQREGLEYVIEEIMKGETIKVEHISNQ